jgi:hypothetical protein
LACFKSLFRAQPSRIDPHVQVKAIGLGIERTVDSDRALGEASARMLDHVSEVAADERIPEEFDHLVRASFMDASPRHELRYSRLPALTPEGAVRFPILLVEPCDDDVDHRRVAPDDPVPGDTGEGSEGWASREGRIFETHGGGKGENVTERDERGELAHVFRRDRGSCSPTRLANDEEEILEASARSLDSGELEHIALRRRTLERAHGRLPDVLGRLDPAEGGVEGHTHLAEELGSDLSREVHGFGGCRRGEDPTCILLELLVTDLELVTLDLGELLDDGPEATARTKQDRARVERVAGEHRKVDDALDHVPNRTGGGPPAPRGEHSHRRQGEPVSVLEATLPPMASRRGDRSNATPKKSALAGLSESQRAELLGLLLERHPQLRSEAEAHARALLSSVSEDEFARAVGLALAACSIDEVYRRSGGTEYGYVDPDEAASELLYEAMEPLRARLRERVALGRFEEAQLICQGILLGLYEERSQDSRDNETVLSMAPEFPDEMADDVIDDLLGTKWRGRRGTNAHAAAKATRYFPEDFWAKVPEWKGRL